MLIASHTRNGLSRFGQDAGTDTTAPPPMDTTTPAPAPGGLAPVFSPWMPPSGWSWVSTTAGNILSPADPAAVADVKKLQQAIKDAAARFGIKESIALTGVLDSSTTDLAVAVAKKAKIASLMNMTSDQAAPLLAANLSGYTLAFANAKPLISRKLMYVGIGVAGAAVLGLGAWMLSHRR